MNGRNFQRNYILLATATAALVCFTPSLSLAQEAEAPEGPDVEEAAEEIVVQATRSGRRVQDEPLRVEVIGREEIEEKILMRPGNITMVLSETGGLRVQITSPALGSSNIRVQGMDGRYTQLLADGLPLYGGQTSSLGLLQIPPTDLGQVEVIKGSVSALYGASALGGVINLVSRRPTDETQFEALLNATTRNGQDATAYRTVSKPYFELGLLGEVVVGKARVFLNAENILNIRQTKYDPLLLRTRAPDGRWTVDVWAPTEGFVLNGGVRLRLGGSH